MTRALANKLKLSGPKLKIRFGNFNSSVVLNSEVVKFTIKSSSNVVIQASNVFIVPEINLSHRNINWPSIKHQWTHLHDLELQKTDSSLVEILIGMDQLSAHPIQNIREPVDGESGPTAIQTIFGWTIVGRIPAFLTNGPSSKHKVNINSISEEVSLTSLTDSFHSTESFGIDIAAPNVMSFDDSQCLKVLQTSIKFIRCGRQVDLPLRYSNLNLPDKNA